VQIAPNWRRFVHVFCLCNLPIGLQGAFRGLCLCPGKLRFPTAKMAFRVPSRAVSIVETASRLSFESQELVCCGIRCSDVKAIITRCGLMLALTFAAVGPACAQTPSAEQKPCSEPGDSSKTLSEKLAQGGGVICPPNVDPGIKVPAPETGKMPVIPPPGSPGGDPNVKPK
jgi:hypothetical protein